MVQRVQAQRILKLVNLMVPISKSEHNRYRQSQIELINDLGIDQLHATVGSSLGGLMAISLAAQNPIR